MASGCQLSFRSRDVVGATSEVVVADGQDERGRLYLSIARWFDVTLGDTPCERQPFILFRNGAGELEVAGTPTADLADAGTESGTLPVGRNGDTVR